jgi:riboflavin synthase
MFTGIIEEIGSVIKAIPSGGGKYIEISAPLFAKELRVNDSVAVNGVCLTVTAMTDTSFATTAVEETLSKTTLDSLARGSRVNLELPVRLNERLGGHLVLGHVDSVGKVTGIERKESSTLVTVEADAAFSKYLIPVGSIALDGVSLTLAEVGKQSFTVSIIPHTMEHTIFDTYVVGSRINIEFDLVGKYIERMAFDRPFPTEDQLRGQGF